MKKPYVGLLPLYIELYDQTAPEKRQEFEKYLKTIANEIRKLDIEVVEAPVCRLRNEFSEAVKLFEDRQVDAIITLHLAYSPSLESAEVLSKTKLPIIILDTTPVFKFGPDQNPDEIFFNHGIHGVQDMCNLLLRNGKSFNLEAGHWQNSDVMSRISVWTKAAAIAGAMRNARVGRIGDSFKGMGDFFVPTEQLKSQIGIETVQYNGSKAEKPAGGFDEGLAKAEMASDVSIFDIKDIDREAHGKTLRSSLQIRKWIEKERLTAFTMNFLDVSRDIGFETIPFMEASKAMSRGIGYAGEGDVLTAALVASLMAIYPETTFTEMFCPDWEGNSIFLSHMAEVNISLVDSKLKFLEINYNYSDADNPVVAVGRLKKGRAVLVNLAPGPGDSYSLIICPVEMLDVQGEDLFENSVRGWLKPSMPVDQFLSAYSKLGGTHHSALVYCDTADIIKKFGCLMGWNVNVIE